MLRSKLKSKGAFIIYLEGGLWWFLRGITLFPYYDIGGAMENFQRKLYRTWGGNHFFSWKRKGNENMMLDSLIIPVFYLIRQNVDTELEYETWCMDKLQAVQNIACKIISVDGKFDLITPFLKGLLWLPVKQPLYLRLSVFAFKCMTGCAPGYLTSKLVKR